MSENEFRNEVRSRALTAVLANALFRWQSAVIIALTTLLYFTVGDIQLFNAQIPAWIWLIGGALAEVAMVGGVLTDPAESQQAVEREFEQKYDLRKVRNRVARQRLEDALEYRRNMLSLVEHHKGAMRVSLKQTIEDVDDWIGHMFNLAQHVDAFESNELVERDRRMVPQQLQNARRRLQLENDPNVQRDLETQIRQMEQQQSNLEAAAATIKRADIQLDSTLSALGTIYAQMSLMGTKEVDGTRAQRLRLEIQDEVSSLQDTISAMDEVYSQRIST